jgi:hypothetical protein
MPLSRILPWIYHFKSWHCIWKISVKGRKHWLMCLVVFALRIKFNAAYSVSRRARARTAATLHNCVKCMVARSTFFGCEKLLTFACQSEMSVMSVLSTQLCELVGTVYTYTVCNGGMEFWASRHINTAAKSLLQVNFFGWGHFALPLSLWVFSFYGCRYSRYAVFVGRAKSNSREDISLGKIILQSIFVPHICEKMIC